MLFRSAQGELTAFVPVEAHRTLVFPERAQPGDEAGFAVVRDDGEFLSVGRDHLPVARVIAVQRFAYQEVPSALDGDMAFLRLLVVDPGDRRQVGGEVRVAKDMAGGNWQNERLRWNGGRATAETFAVSSDEPSAVLGREEHAVEDLACGVCGCAPGDVGESPQRGWACAWACRAAGRAMFWGEVAGSNAQSVKLAGLSVAALICR